MRRTEIRSALRMRSVSRWVEIERRNRDNSLAANVDRSSYLKVNLDSQHCFASSEHKGGTAMRFILTALLLWVIVLFNTGRAYSDCYCFCQIPNDGGCYVQVGSAYCNGGSGTSLCSSPLAYCNFSCSSHSQRLSLTPKRRLGQRSIGGVLRVLSASFEERVDP